MRSHLIAAGLGIVLGGCSGNNQGTNSACPHTGDLAIIGEDCPATYDGTEANLPVCPTADDIGFPVVDRTVWQCQDLNVLRFASGLGALACSYDTTSRALVGAERETDTRCDNLDVGVEAGRTNRMCRENAPLFSRVCTAP